MAMTIGDRFKILRIKLGLNQSELAREIGANPSIISDIERGDKEPSKKIISGLILKYRLNSNWLLTERGDIFTQDKVAEKSRLEQDLEEVITSQVSPQFAAIEERLSRLEASLGGKGGYEAPGNGGGEGFTGDPKPLYTAEKEKAYEEEEYCEEEERVKIPHVANIAAGPPIAQSEDQSELVAAPARLIKRGYRYYAADIRGGSMSEAGIRDGDTVLIRHTDTPANGAIQVVRYQGKSTLKRLRETKDGGWEIHYEDGSGKAVRLDSGDYEVQGEFVAVLPKNSVPGASKKGRGTREKPFENC